MNKNTDINKVFGEVLMRTRKQAGYSQEQLALDCKVHRTYISSVERGLKSPSMNIVNKLLSTLNISFSEFYKVIDILLNPNRDVNLEDTCCNKMLSQQIIDNLKEHILLLTLNHKVISSNKRVRKFFKITKKSEKNENEYSTYFMSDSDNEKNLTAFAKVLDTKKLVNFINIIYKGKKKYIFEITMSPIFNSGVLDAIIEVRKDITEKIKLENKTDKTTIKRKNKQTKNTRILIMEDTLLLRELFTSVLTNLGFNVSAVANGTLAIEELRQEKENGKDYDIVILDLMIFNGLGGIDTLKRLKELIPNIKSIAISGYSNYDLKEINEAGFDKFLSKPVDMYKLEQTIYDLIFDI